MNKIIWPLLLTLLFVPSAFAIEIVRQKNVATRITFPLVDADGDAVTSAGALDSEIDTWTDGTNPNGYADCTNEATEISTSGSYYLSLTATEMDNDYIIIQIKSTSAKTQWILIRTQVGDVLNNATTDDGTTINVASGVVESNLEQIRDGVQSATDLKDFCDDGYDPATNLITGAVAIYSMGSNSIGPGDIAEDAITATTIAAGAMAKGTEITGFNDLSAAQVKAEVDTALGDYDGPTNTEMTSAFTEIKGATWAGTDTLEAIRDRGDAAWITADDPWSTSLPGAYGAGTAGNIVGNNLDATVSSRGTSTVTTAQVKTEVDTALGDYDGPTNTEMTSAFTEIKGATWAGTDTLEAIRDRGDAAWITADDPWSTSLPGAYGAGTAGNIVGNNLDATVSSRGTSTVTTAQVKTEVDTALGDYDGPTNTEMTSAFTEIKGATWAGTDTLEAIRDSVDIVDGIADDILIDTSTTLPSQIAGLNDLSTAEVDTALSDFWTSPGTLVDLIWDEDVDSSHQTAGTAGKKLDDAGAAGDPWSTSLPGAYGAGTAGYIIGNNIDATVSSRGTSTVTTAQVKTEVDTALGDYDGPTNTEMTSAFTEIKGATWAGTDTLEAIRDSVDIVDGIADDILIDTSTTLPSQIAGLNDLSTAEVDTALSDFWTSPGTLVDLIWDEDVDSSHQTAGTAGKKLDDAGAAGDPWSTSLPGAYGAGTAGYIIGNNIDATVSSRGTSTVTTAQVKTEVDTALGDYDGPTNTEMTSAFTEIKGATWAGTDTLEAIRDSVDIVDGIADDILIDTSTTLPSQIAGLNDLSTAEVDTALSDFWTSPGTLVDLIWDEDVDSSHQTAGTAGKKLDDAGAAGDPWSTSLPGAYGAGTAGYIIGNNIDATVSSRGTSTVTTAQVKTEVDTALGDYDGPTNTEMTSAFTEIKGATWAGTDTLEAIRDSVDIVDGIADDILLDTSTRLPSQIAGQNDLSTAEVKTQADQALSDFFISAATLVDLMWDEDVDTSHQTAGTAGKKLDDAGAAADPWATAIPGAYGAGTAGYIIGNNIDATVSSRGTSTVTTAQVKTEVDTALSDFWTSAATLVDLVWDEDVDTSHQTAGTAGKKLDDSGAAADPWATSLPGAYGAGTAGYMIGNNSLQTGDSFARIGSAGAGLTSLPNVTLANGAHGGGAATIVLSDYSQFQGAASPLAMWTYDISGITDAGASGDYLNNLATGKVTVVGPVLSTNALSLVRGDAYHVELGNALEWSSDDWTDLTGATITFSLRRKEDRRYVIEDVAGSVVVAGSGTQTIRVQLENTDWLFLDSGVVEYEYDCEATKNGRRFTLVRATATVTDDVTRGD